MIIQYHILLHYIIRAQPPEAMQLHRPGVRESAYAVDADVKQNNVFEALLSLVGV